MAKTPKHIKQKQYCNIFNKDKKKKKRLAVCKCTAKGANLKGAYGGGG